MRVSYNLDTSDIIMYNSIYFNKFVKWSTNYISNKAICSMVLYIFFHLISQNLSNTYILYLGIVIALLSFFILDHIIKYEAKKNIEKRNDISTTGGENTIELVDNQIIYITPKAQLNINISEIQCIYYYSEYLFLFFSKASAIIIPKMKINDGSVDELHNKLKSRYIEINRGKELMKDDNCISFINFHNRFKTDMFNWVIKNKIKVTIYLFVLLIILAFIFGYPL